MYSHTTCLKYQIWQYMTDLGYDVKYEPKIVYHNKGFLVNKINGLMHGKSFE